MQPAFLTVDANLQPHVVARADLSLVGHGIREIPRRGVRRALTPVQAHPSAEKLNDGLSSDERSVGGVTLRGARAHQHEREIFAPAQVFRKDCILASVTDGFR